VISISLLASPALATSTAPGPVADAQPRVISHPHSRTPATPASVTNPSVTSTDSETTTAVPETSAPPTDGTTTDVPTSDDPTSDDSTSDDPTSESSTSAPTTTPPSPPGPDIPTINWTPCRGAFQCARTTAPLDYDRPFATTISLALIRLPAADPAQRIGSLFVNPGGPGGSGVDFVRQAGRSLPLELRGRFDIIGFDPRGVAESTPLRCFATFQEAVAVLPPFAFPINDEEQAQWRTGDQALSAACADRGGAIQNHMSTANVARDLDLLRQAVGDDKLNFLGYSYGSSIGATYANLFPDRVGALVVDGLLNPVAWSTGTDDESATLPFTSRLGSDASASSTWVSSSGRANGRRVAAQIVAVDVHLLGPHRLRLRKFLRGQHRGDVPDHPSVAGGGHGVRSRRFTVRAAGRGAWPGRWAGRTSIRAALIPENMRRAVADAGS